MQNLDELKTSATVQHEIYALVEDPDKGVVLCIVQVWNVDGNRLEKELGRVEMSFRAFDSYAKMIAKFNERILTRFAIKPK